jgi:hypothetical protein
MEVTNRTRRAALIRALCAVLAALVLLAVTNFSVFRLLAGPRPLEALTEAELGTYTVRELDSILDFYAEETTGGDVTAWYAVVPQGDMLVTYLLPSGYFSAAETVLYDTVEWLNGRLETRGRYFTAAGTVARLEPEAEELLYQWFSEAGAQLRAAGVVGDSEDYADCLSPYVVRVDRVGRWTPAAVWALSGAAALLAVYAAIVAVRIGLGKYRDGAAAQNSDPREETKE